MKKATLSVVCWIACFSTALALTPTDYLVRQKISFTNYSAPEMLTNFPVLVRINALTPYTYSRMASPIAGDLRFTDADGTNDIPYEIESWDTNSESLVWVRVPALSNGASIYAYWGNPADTSPPAYTTNGAVWLQDYAGVWHMTEPDARDSTSHDFNGTAVNAVSNGNGAIGMGQELIPNSRIDITDTSGSRLDILSNITLSAWIQVDTFGNWDGIISKGVTTSPYAMQLWSDGSLRFSANYNAPPGGVGGGSWNSDTKIPPGRWTYSVITYDGATIRFYLDGVQAPNPPAAALTLGTNDENLVLGADLPDGDEYFDGIMDELRVSSVARSSNWIMAAWANQSSSEVFNLLDPVDILDPDIPIIHTQPASGITDSEGTMEGELVATGAAATAVYLFYGTNDAGTAASGWATNVFLGTNTLTPPVSFAHTLTGLPRYITYYYRYFATNATASWWGDTRAFTVHGPPVVDHGAGAVVGIGTAGLSGRYLTSDRGDITYCWGRSDGGMDTGTWDAVQQVLSIDTPRFSSTVTGLLYGVDYFYRLYATNMYGDNWTPTTALFRTQAPPGLDLVNVAPVGLLETSAVLRADLSAPGSEFDVLVYWGRADGGTSSVLWTNQQFLGTFTNIAFTNLSLSIGGLQSNTMYAFAFRMTNLAEDTWAQPTLWFETLSTPQVDNASGATDIRLDGATLNGTLLEGSQAEISFYYGTSDGGTDPAAWDGFIRPGVRGEGTVSMSVTGLSSTTYYYRTYATNGSGGAWAPWSEVFSVIDLNGFRFKSPITFCGYTGTETLSNIPLLVVLGTNLSGFRYDQLTHPTTGTDLRFMNGAENKELNFEIDRWDTNGRSYVWVQVPELTGTNTSVVAYWGHATITNVPAYTTNGAAWSESYAGVWHLEERDAVDSSSGRFDGTGQGDTTNAPGIIGDGQSFDGAGDYIALPNLGFNGDVSVTLESWVRADQLANDAFVGFGQIAAGGRTSIIRSFGDGGFRYYFWGNDLDALGTGSYTGRWTHVAAVYDAVNSERSIFKNGVRVVTDAPADPNFADTAYRIAGCNGEWVDGVMDEVRISQAPRSSNWIWATWYNVASNDGFNCYQPIEIVGDFDLALTKTADQSTFFKGSNVTYTITVTNSGRSDVSSITVTDILPGALVFTTSAPPRSPASSGSTNVFTFPNITAGGSITITMVVGVVESAVITVTNTATVATTNNESRLDNNVDSAETTIPDNDGDGINNAVDPDDDEDGMRDDAERIAGTDPLDERSFLRLEIARGSNQWIRILTFPGVTSRTYHVQNSTNILVDAWANVQTNIPGPPVSNELINLFQTNPLDRVFYRIGVEFP